MNSHYLVSHFVTKCRSTLNKRVVVPVRPFKTKLNYFYLSVASHFCDVKIVFPSSSLINSSLQIWFKVVPKLYTILDNHKWRHENLGIIKILLSRTFSVVSCDLIPFMWVMLLAHTSILTNKQKSYTIPPPFTFDALKVLFYMLKNNVPSYLTLTFYCAQKGKESEWNLLPNPKKCYFHSPVYNFWPTMTSEKESNIYLFIYLFGAN